MNHLSETALEHYLLGGDELAAETVERHILECDDCAAQVRAQVELEMQLAEVARAAKFCPGCNRVLDGDRCDACGATVVAGGYRIERVLVKTTHGRLYVAVDGNGKRVALKELAFVQAPTLESLAAFDRETKFLRALSHPSIPKFHASFIEGTGIHTRMYIAQDLVEGQSLLARLSDHWFAEAEIIAIARHVLDILVYLQSLSPMVFHRDIKPANLIARADGSIALVDFGAARDVSETMGNTAVGTFGYMPMEQMAGVYDATTDLYALGATLLHLLTRREPWKLLDGGGVGVNVSPGLRAYLDRLCAPRRGDRFPDARAALAAIGDLRAPAPAKRSLSRAGMIGVVAVLGAGIAAGAGLAMMDDGSPPERPTPARIVEPVRPIEPARPVAPPVATEIEIAPRPAALRAEDLLEPGLVHRLADRRHCTIDERLPSRRWPSYCAQAEARSCTVADRLPDGRWPFDCIQALPDLAIDQLAGARARLLDHPGAGIAAGKIIVDKQQVPYAIAVTGPFEVALHGYHRVRVEPEVRPGETRTLADVVLVPVGDQGATVMGAVPAKARLRATLMFEGGPSEHTIEEVVEGRFTLSGFTPGRYRITIIVEGSTTGAASEETIIDVRAGQRFDLRAKRPLPSPKANTPGELQVQSKPPTRVVIDGQEVGATPLRLSLAPGLHRVTFTALDGSGTWNATVSIKPGETYRMIKDFSASTASWVELASKPPARVSVDGIDTGLNTPAKIKLSPGRHKITFQAGTSKWTFPITVKAGETLKMVKELSPP